MRNFKLCITSYLTITALTMQLTQWIYIFTKNGKQSQTISSMPIKWALETVLCLIGSCDENCCHNKMLWIWQRSQLNMFVVSTPSIIGHLDKKAVYCHRNMEWTGFTINSRHKNDGDLFLNIFEERKTSQHIDLHMMMGIFSQDVINIILHDVSANTVMTISLPPIPLRWPANLLSLPAFPNVS